MLKIQLDEAFVESFCRNVAATKVDQVLVFKPGTR